VWSHVDCFTTVKKWRQKFHHELHVQSVKYYSSGNYVSPGKPENSSVNQNWYITMSNRKTKHHSVCGLLLIFLASFQIYTNKTHQISSFFNFFGGGVGEGSAICSFLHIFWYQAELYNSGSSCGSLSFKFNSAHFAKLKLMNFLTCIHFYSNCINTFWIPTSLLPHNVITVVAISHFQPFYEHINITVV
jgi:hypothetical protein